MSQNLSAFQIKKDGKVLDYRVGQKLDLINVSNHFKQNGYDQASLRFAGRHIVGTVKKRDIEYFIKLATTEGMSYLTEIEYGWNKEVNKLISRDSSDFWVPMAIDSGYYQDILFYHVSDIFRGVHLADQNNQFSANPELVNNLNRVIKCSEIIQDLVLQLPNRDGELTEPDHIQRFLQKTQLWYESIPSQVREEYKIQELLEFVKKGASSLARKSRHGDFTPWHMLLLENGKLGLLDGEHAIFNGVEYYDMAYFIQRIFSVMKDTGLAQTVLDQLNKKRYNNEKLRIVMAARAIGGFLDESLSEVPNYIQHKAFREFIKL